MKSLVDRLGENKKEALKLLETAEGVEKPVEWLVSLDPDMDPKRITRIDDGDGYIIFVVGVKGYQPSFWWYTRAGYGSCSARDAWEATTGHDGEPNLEDRYSLLHDIAADFRQMFTGDQVA